MKYSEFEIIAKENGWEIDMDEMINKWVYADKNGFEIAISKSTQNYLDLYARQGGIFELHREKEFIEACYELAKTPLEDREEPKKYYLKHKFLGCDMYGRYLNIDFKDGVYFIASKETCVGEYQTAFTKLEIEEIKGRYGVTLEDFEIIEILESESDSETVDEVEEC